MGRRAEGLDDGGERNVTAAAEPIEGGFKDAPIANAHGLRLLAASLAPASDAREAPQKRNFLYVMPLNRSSQGLRSIDLGRKSGA
jgi:hypothetical protein